MFVLNFLEVTNERHISVWVSTIEGQTLASAMQLSFDPSSNSSD